MCRSRMRLKSPRDHPPTHHCGGSLFARALRGQGGGRAAHRADGRGYRGRRPGRRIRVYDLPIASEKIVGGLRASA